MRLDGSVVEVEAAGLPVDWDDQPAHLIMNRDVTSRREAEQLSTRLRHIIDDPPNEVYIFNEQTLKFLQVNRGPCENLGYTADELMTMTPLDIKLEHDAETSETSSRP